MDPNSLKALQGAAGAAGGDETKYVEEVFSTEVYHGDSSNNITVTNGLDMDGEGGLVWSKSRTQEQHHILIDTVRGKTKYLKSEADTQEQTNAYFITDFLSDGYVTGCCDGAADAINWSGHDFVSWSFRKAPGFFDIVTYTGASSNATQTLSHDLACVPGMILVKNLTKVDTNLYSWAVYHKHVDSSAPQGYRMLLDTDAARSSTSSTDEWGNTAPTASGFTVGGSSLTNLDGHDFVAYLFADGADAGAQIFGDDDDESIVKCGEFDAGGSGDVAVTLGFEPQWLMVKQYSGAGGDWFIFDNMRGFGAKGGTNYMMRAHANNTEGSYADYLRPSSDGFVVDGSSLGNHQYVYMAIRRGPMKTPTDATKVFAIDYGSGSSTIPTWDSGFPVDMAIARLLGTSNDWPDWYARLLGPTYMRSDDTHASAGDGSIKWDSNKGYGTAYTSSEISWMFKRAPGFFDVVAYSGTNLTHTEAHNLGKQPEMMIIKCRNATEHWAVYHKDLTSAGHYLWLDDNQDEDTNSSWLNSTDPDESDFTVGAYSNISNGPSETYVAYLFASCPGVSSVGKYIGNDGSEPIHVHCDGFTNGARFVMIKRRDGTDHWYVFDTLRGINANGNDSYIYMNEQHQVQSWDLIEPLSTGFTIDTATTALNVDGETFIYLAIA